MKEPELTNFQSSLLYGISKIIALQQQNLAASFAIAALMKGDPTFDRQLQTTFEKSLPDLQVIALREMVRILQQPFPSAAEQSDQQPDQQAAPDNFGETSGLTVEELLKQLFGKNDPDKET